jgi:hypothetical protein
MLPSVGFYYYFQYFFLFFCVCPVSIQNSFQVSVSLYSCCDSYDWCRQPIPRLLRRQVDTALKHVDIPPYHVREILIVLWQILLTPVSDTSCTSYLAPVGFWCSSPISTVHD